MYLAQGTVAHYIHLLGSAVLYEVDRVLQGVTLQLVHGWQSRIMRGAPRRLSKLVEQLFKVMLQEITDTYVCAQPLLLCLSHALPRVQPILTAQGGVIRAVTPEPWPVNKV